MDRRTKRTRRALHRALIELLLEKGYDRISVQDILDRADVGRSTFYGHYQNKDDLLVVSCTEYLRDVVGGSPAAPSDSPMIAVRALLDLAAGHRSIYRALAGRRSSGVLIRATQATVADVLRDHLAPHVLPTDLERALTFLSCGLTGMLGSIADADSAEAATAAADHSYRLLEALVRI